jgi:hypothetical protein
MFSSCMCWLKVCKAKMYSTCDTLMAIIQSTEACLLQSPCSYLSILLTKNPIHIKSYHLLSIPLSVTVPSSQPAILMHISALSGRRPATTERHARIDARVSQHPRLRLRAGSAAYTRTVPRRRRAGRSRRAARDQQADLAQSRVSGAQLPRERKAC